MEADCHVEECAPQPIGVVYLPRHLQHGGDIAHSLYFVLPENRATSPVSAAQNLSHLET